MPSLSGLLRLGLVLAGVLLLSASLVAALLVVRIPRGEPSRKAYDRIKIGMARPEAEAILGDWTRQLVRRHRDTVTVGWEGPDGATIEVDFDARGRVAGKQIAENDRPLAEVVQRLLKHVQFW
jgi:hypothetical protein